MIQAKILGSKTPCKRSGYQETVVKFTLLGQPKGSSNPNYITNDAEYNALREVFPWLIDAGKNLRQYRTVAQREKM